MEDKFVRHCEIMAKHIVALNNVDYDAEHVCSVASQIAQLASMADARIANPAYTDAYLKEIRDNRRLDPNRTSVANRTPLSVCCSMYGLWTAVPILIYSKFIGMEDDQIDLSLCINFSWDLLNWVLPDGMESVKGVNSDGVI